MAACTPFSPTPPPPWPNDHLETLTRPPPRRIVAEGRLDAGKAVVEAASRRAGSRPMHGGASSSSSSLSDEDDSAFGRVGAEIGLRAPRLGGMAEGPVSGSTSTSRSPSSSSPTDGPAVSVRAHDKEQAKPSIEQHTAASRNRPGESATTAASGQYDASTAAPDRTESSISGSGGGGRLARFVLLRGVHWNAPGERDGAWFHGLRPPLEACSRWLQFCEQLAICEHKRRLPERGEGSFTCIIALQ